MKTYISWDSSVESEAKIIRNLPETAFECPKLNKGDVISLDVGRVRGPRILTPVKVAYVNVSLSWDAVGKKKQAKISEAEQMVYIEPVILTSENTDSQSECLVPARKSFQRNRWRVSK